MTKCKAKCKTKWLMNLVRKEILMVSVTTGHTKNKYVWRWNNRNSLVFIWVFCRLRNRNKNQRFSVSSYRVKLGLESFMFGPLNLTRGLSTFWLLKCTFNVSLNDLPLYKSFSCIRCFPGNFAKILRTPFLQNTSGGCFWHYPSRQSTVQKSTIETSENSVEYVQS